MINKIVNTLESERKKIKIILIIYYLINAAAMAIAFFNINAAIGIVACNTVVYIGIFCSGFSRFRHDYTKYNIEYGIGSVLKGLQYQKKGGIRIKDVRETRLIPIQDSDKGFIVRHLISGLVGKTSIRIAEIATHYSASAESGIKQQIFLSGTWIEADLENQQHPDFIITDKRIAEPGAYVSLYKESGYRLVEDDEKLLEENLNLYSRGNYLLVDIVPERIIKLVNTLQKNTNMLFALCIQKSKFRIFLSGRFYTTKLKLKQLITPELISYNRLPERDIVLKLINR